MAIFAVGMLCACSSSHSGAVPATPSEFGLASSRAHALSIGSVSGDVVAIDSGSTTAVGGFAADVDYLAGWTETTSATFATGSIPSPAPQSVYASQRLGTSFSYTIPGLSPGASYFVVLSFAETFFNSAGKRVFNVAINGSTVLSKFDVFATAGAIDTVVAKSFPATASSTGTISIAFTAVTNNAIVNAIEIRANGATPTPVPSPTAPPSGSVWINSGGPAVGSYAADTDYTANSTFAITTASTVFPGSVPDPAPSAVYQSQRVGPTVTYTIPSLTIGRSYNVQLDFSENFFTSAGARVFNATINGTTVLTNFDIFATAGAFTAVAKSFTATPNSSGKIVIALTASVNNAAIDAIEITPVASASPTPSPSAFNDYPTFGYDNARDVFNPNSTALTPATVPNVHLAWQARAGTYNTQTQPILATGVAGHAGILFVGDGGGYVHGIDALTGTQVWQTFIGQETYQSAACGPTVNYFGVGGTAAYDPASKSIYIVGNSNPSLNAYSTNALFHLDAATGTILGQVNFTPTAAGSTEINFGHTAVTLANGIAYAGTGTTCDIPSWRGRVVAVNVPAMTLANTFFTVWDPQNTRGQGKQPWGGGGIWGWGGVTIDPAGNVLTGVGNADNGLGGKDSPPFVTAPQEYSGYAESLLKLTPSLSTVLSDNHPIPLSTYNNGVSNDLDVQGTPLVFTPNGAGCGTMVALQGKSGELTIYNEAQISSGFVAQYQLSPSTYSDGYLGDPSYSAATGLMYAPVASSVSPTLFAPGLIAINPGCGSPSVAWHASFGIDSTAAGVPRAVPAPSAGGVILAGTVGAGGSGGDVWAINASTGAVLNGGNPILVTSGSLRMPPVIDGEWIFIIDNGGHVYGLTLDPDYPAINPRYDAPDASHRLTWGSHR